MLWQATMKVINMPITRDSIRNRKSYEYWDKLYEWGKANLGLSHDGCAKFLLKFHDELYMKNGYKYRWQSWASIDSLTTLITDKEHGWIRPIGSVPRWKVIEQRRWSL
jgi:hypothetical protein